MWKKEFKGSCNINVNVIQKSYNYVSSDINTTNQPQWLSKLLVKGECCGGGDSLPADSAEARPTPSMVRSEIWVLSEFYWWKGKHGEILSTPNTRQDLWVSKLQKWVGLGNWGRTAVISLRLLSRTKHHVANRGNNSASASDHLRYYLSFERAAGQLFCGSTLLFIWRKVLKIEVVLFIQSWQPSSKIFLSISILNYTTAHLGASSQIITDLCSYSNVSPYSTNLSRILKVK